MIRKSSQTGTTTCWPGEHDSAAAWLIRQGKVWGGKTNEQVQCTRTLQSLQVNLSHSRNKSNTNTAGLHCPKGKQFTKVKLPLFQWTCRAQPNRKIQRQNVYLSSYPGKLRNLPPDRLVRDVTTDSVHRHGHCVDCTWRKNSNLVKPPPRTALLVHRCSFVFPVSRQLAGWKSVTL